MATSKENLKLRISAQDSTKGALSSITKGIQGVVGAYLGWKAIDAIIVNSISKHMDYEATLISLKGVVKATGRDINEVYTEMKKHMGGLASEANVATGFLKGMTTTLSVQQISKMTIAIKDASIAMGEDFNIQLPMIIKAVKQLNPAILDNIGVTVRLDKVNRRITQGFYGAGKAINEFTQQNAIYQEIMKQTAIFQGQEAIFLETAKGKYQQMTAVLDDTAVRFGELLMSITPVVVAIEFLTDTIRGLGEIFDWLTPMTTSYVANTKEQTEAVDWLKDSIVDLNVSLADQIALTDMIKNMEAFNEQLEKGFSGEMELDPELFTNLSAAIENFQYTTTDVLGVVVNDVNITAEAFGNFKKSVNFTEDEIQGIMDGTAAVNAGRIKLLEEALVYEEELIEESEEVKLATQTEFAKIWARTEVEKFDFAMLMLKDLVKGAAKEEEKAVSGAQRNFEKFTNSMQGTMKVGMDGIVRKMLTGQGEFKSIFKSMADDFMHFFTKQALATLVNLFIPGLGSILGGIFDTPANDKMAMTQGKHFAQFFTKGTMDFMESFDMASTLSGASGFNVSNPTQSGLTGGRSVINVNFYGNITDERFVKDTIMPIIQQAIVGGESDISINDPTITGSPEVRYS